MTRTDEIFQRQRELSRERAYCLAVLELWAQAKGQGIDHETVKGFGFDPEFCTSRKEREASRKWRTTRDKDGARVCRAPYFNYARHHDGTKTKLDPPLRAVYRDR